MRIIIVSPEHPLHLGQPFRAAGASYDGHGPHRVDGYHLQGAGVVDVLKVALAVGWPRDAAPQLGEQVWVQGQQELNQRKFFDVTGDALQDHGGENVQASCLVVRGDAEVVVDCKTV